MTDETVDQKREKYLRLCHSMQAGVAATMHTGKDCEPKHLRVGINAAMSDLGAISALLIEKGVFTEEEMYDYLIKYMDNEVKAYEASVADGHDTKVKLY